MTSSEHFFFLKFTINCNHILFAWCIKCSLLSGFLLYAPAFYLNCCEIVVLLFRQYFLVTSQTSDFENIPELNCDLKISQRFFHAWTGQDATCWRKVHAWMQGLCEIVKQNHKDDRGC